MSDDLIELKASKNEVKNFFYISTKEEMTLRMKAALAATLW